ASNNVLGVSYLRMEGPLSGLPLSGLSAFTFSLVMAMNIGTANIPPQHSRLGCSVHPFCARMGVTVEAVVRPRVARTATVSNTVHHGVMHHHREMHQFHRKLNYLRLARDLVT
ncbi:hypothetical protein BGX38DRAFT_1191747, partial [Terfezia claveryi]